MFAQLTHGFLLIEVHAVSTRVSVYEQHSATSGFSPIRGAAFGLLQPISRPPPPAFGHLRYRKQSFDFIAITVVDAKYISDLEIVIRRFHDRDLVSSPHVALDDYPEVSPGSQRLGEAARKHLIVHPNSKPPARYSRLGNLENCRPDLPALSDERIVHVNPFGREIFAQLAIGKRSADFLFPPTCILDGVCVDHFIGSPVRLAIGLVISGKIYTSDGDPTEDW
jgi:hypothetical protein